MHLLMVPEFESVDRKIEWFPDEVEKILVVKTEQRKISFSQAMVPLSLESVVSTRETVILQTIILFAALFLSCENEIDRIQQRKHSEKL